MKKIIVFILLSLAFVVGCNNSNSIVGTWNYYKDGKTSNDINYNFEKGNTGSYTYAGNTRNFTYEDRGTKIIIKYDGDTNSSEYDYSISDGTLTIKDSFGSNVTYKRK